MVAVTNSDAVQLACFAPLGGAEYFPSTVPQLSVLGSVHININKKNGNETGWHGGRTKTCMETGWHDGKTKIHAKGRLGYWRTEMVITCGDCNISGRHIDTEQHVATCACV